MDRKRIIKQIRAKGVPSGGEILKVLDTLGPGGKGVALLCRAGGDKIVAKVYVPPDKRDLDESALARFESEIKLTSKIRHPNVVRAIASGRMVLGAYSLPFYLMPRATSTLRSFTSHHADDPAKIEARMRLFLRAALGVACLHSHGVVHRDLKPENILIGKDGEPWVADLGIAHVNPDFVSVGVKTLASERLRNGDYYAPEQRFGKATDVDSRADIYALGYIMYELFAGSPPVRSSSPALAKINTAFGVLDPVFSRMTAHEPKDRYQFIEDAIEEISIVFGCVRNDPTLTARCVYWAAWAVVLPAPFLIIRAQYDAWKEVDREWAAEKAKNEVPPQIHIKEIEHIPRGSLRDGVTDLFVYLDLELKAPSHVVINGYSATLEHSTQSITFSAVDDMDQWVKEHDGDRQPCVPIVKELTVRGDPVRGWVHFKLSGVADAFVGASIVLLKIHCAYGCCNYRFQPRVIPEGRRGYMRRIRK